MASGRQLSTRGESDAKAPLPWGMFRQTLRGCSGDLVSRPSNGPYWASYGLLWRLMGY